MIGRLNNAQVLKENVWGEGVEEALLKQLFGVVVDESYNGCVNSLVRLSFNQGSI